LDEEEEEEEEEECELPVFFGRGAIGGKKVFRLVPGTIG